MEEWSKQIDVKGNVFNSCQKCKLKMTIFILINKRHQDIWNRMGKHTCRFFKVQRDNRWKNIAIEKWISFKQRNKIWIWFEKNRTKQLCKDKCSSN